LDSYSDTIKRDPHQTNLHISTFLSPPVKEWGISPCKKQAVKVGKMLRKLTCFFYAYTIFDGEFFI